jgi:hypothetical protein
MDKEIALKGYPVKYSTHDPITFEEIKALYPDAVENNWHKHPNGGGWVENIAIVEDTAYVSSVAIVKGASFVEGPVEVGSLVLVDNAILRSSQKFRGECILSVYGGKGKGNDNS